MFERFTHRARRVVVLAHEEACLLNHNYIGTEHILLGLIHERVEEGGGVAAQVLDSFDIKLDDVRAEIVEIIGKGSSAPSGHIPFTPRAKKVLELSLREALQLGHNYIGTEHILLGLIREGEGVAAQVLVKLGADLTETRQVVVTKLAAMGDTRGAHDRRSPLQTDLDDSIMVQVELPPADFQDAVGSYTSIKKGLSQDQPADALFAAMAREPVEASSFSVLLGDLRPAIMWLQAIRTVTNLSLDHPFARLTQACRKSLNELKPAR